MMPPRCAVAAAGALTLSMACACNAATLSVDDSIPGELNVMFANFDHDASVNGADPTVLGTVTVPGETVSFAGRWSVSEIQPGAGVVYIVDFGQSNLVRTRIDATWGPDSEGVAVIHVTVTSTPFGEHLGLMPDSFYTKGLWMPDGPNADIASLFRDVVTAETVPAPENLIIRYIGDLQPDPPDPMFYSYRAVWNRASLYSDRDDSTRVAQEIADEHQFESNMTVRSMRWWGAYGTVRNISTQVDPDDFVLNIYEDIDGAPGVDPAVIIPLPHTVRTGIGEGSGIGPLFVYGASFPAPITLRADTRYWFSFVNNTVRDEVNDWRWDCQWDNNVQGYFRSPVGAGKWGLWHFDASIEFRGVEDGVSACPPDVTDDGVVDGRDVARLLAGWGECDESVLSQAPDRLTHHVSDQDETDGAFEQSDNIRLDADATVYAIRWWGTYDAPAGVEVDTDDFELRVYADEAGAPSVAPAATLSLDAVRASTGMTIASSDRPEFVYNATLPTGLSLDGERVYWLTIINNTTTDSIDQQWRWESSAGGDGVRASRRGLDDGAWDVPADHGDAAIELLTVGCREDLDGRNGVGMPDLAQLIVNWGPCAAH